MWCYGFHRVILKLKYETKLNFKIELFCQSCKLVGAKNGKSELTWDISAKTFQGQVSKIVWLKVVKVKPKTVCSFSRSQRWLDSNSLTQDHETLVLQLFYYRLPQWLILKIHKHASLFNRSKNINPAKQHIQLAPSR